MADITNIPYADIVASSWLPAILYYVAYLHPGAQRRGKKPRARCRPTDRAAHARARHRLAPPAPIGAMIGMMLAG